MSQTTSCLYDGEVVHKRVRPVAHHLRYSVYNLFADVDELPALSQRLRLFSYNRLNLFSVSDRQFGPGDGTSISEHVWSLVKAAGQGDKVKRIFMLCFPAVFGRTFNPLTTYYCCDDSGHACLMVYEVSNTFGERHTYVVPAGDDARHSHAKAFYVSPFNTVAGRYDFVAAEPGNKLFLGITLQVEDLPVLQAWFSGARTPLNDRTLMRAFFSMPLQPVKVMLGIHFEALRLWWKGLRLTPRPQALSPNISIAKTADRRGRPQ
jgi:DUF1365 family protein